MISGIQTLRFGLCALALAACDAPPEYLAIAGDPREAGPAPPLLPIDDVLAIADRSALPQPQQDATTSLEARAAALQSRASALSDTQVVDDTTRTAMQDALNRRSAQ